MNETNGRDVPAYPVQNAYTRDIRAAAAKANCIEFMSLWVGQAAQLGRAVPASDLVASVAREAAERLSAFESR